MTIFDVHYSEYLRPSGLQFETVLGAGDGDRNAASRSGRFRQQMGAKRRKKRGIKQKAVLSKIMERTAQNRVILKRAQKKKKSRNPHGYWIFRWRSGWDSNPRAREDYLISSLCVYCLLAFLQSRTVPKKSRLHKGFSDKMTLKGIVRDGSNIISIFPYPSKIRKIGGMFGGMLYYFL